MSHELKKNIRLLGEGDEKAFEKVYYAYIPKVRSFLIKINLTHALDDVIQDTFITLWKKRDHIDSHKSFDSYLFTIAKNHSIKALKKQMQHFLLDPSEAQGLSDEPEAISETVLYEKLDLLKNSIEKLPERPKQILMLKRYEGLSIDEISVRLGLSKSTVQNHMNKAIKTLRKELSGNLHLLLTAFFIGH